MCQLCIENYDDLQDEIEETNTLIVFCNNIDTIPSFNWLRHLSIYSCHSLTHIPPIRSLVILDINACLGILYIPSFPYLAQLRISASRIREIPSMPRLVKLCVSRCTQLRRIRSQPRLRELSCNGTPRIMFNSVDKHPLLYELELVNVPLFKLPDEYLSLRTLKLEDMTYITSVPKYPHLNTLIIQRCHIIKTLPEFPSLHYLEVVQRTNDLFPFTIPKELEELYILKLVDVNIESIPYIPSITVLELYDCSKLTINHKFPELDTLIMNACPLIKQIPSTDYNRLEVVMIERMPHLEIFNRFYQTIGFNNTDRDKNCEKLKFLQRKFRWYYENRRIIKFLKMNKTIEFSEWFWNPDHYGGRWCIDRLNRKKPSFKFEADQLLQSSQ
jgi:hypothetical protein